MYKAVVVDMNYGSVSHEKLKLLQKEYEKNGITLHLGHYATEDEMIAACQDADAILGTGNPPVTRKVLEALPQLKLVQRFGIGVNSIDLEAASDMGTLAMFMPGFCVDELAAHAASLILSLIRNTAYYDRGIRRGEWPKATYFVPKNVSDVTLGLYGFGGSAKPLYEIFRNGFHSKVITCDPFFPDEVKKDYDVEFVTFDQMLEQSDIISIHAPLTPETRHIFNKTAFQKMKNDAMIINVARGDLICEPDLIEALQTGEIRFAGLDVFAKEPIDPNNPLLKMDNVVLTCHSAFYGEKAQATQLELAVSLVNDVLNNNTVPARYIANKEVIKKAVQYNYI